mmetsp:Transcript_23299/g.55044  ORF Transcript_23299/g.55044 Transcript_23299/m.55044 type:complete len:127 (-) Transcript_23299:627-1007(-)
MLRLDLTAMPSVLVHSISPSSDERFSKVSVRLCLLISAQVLAGSFKHDKENGDRPDKSDCCDDAEYKKRTSSPFPDVERVTDSKKDDPPYHAHFRHLVNHTHPLLLQVLEEELSRYAVQVCDDRQN